MSTLRFRNLKVALFAAAVFSASVANAAPVVRADFGAPAVVTNIGFGGATVGGLTPSTPDFAAFGGVVTNTGANLETGGVGLFGNFYKSRLRDDPSTTEVESTHVGIRLTFSNAVSAVGFDVAGNIGTRFVLSIYDSGNTLLERLVRTWDTMDLVDPSDNDSAVVGFLGLERSNNNIAYATVASLVGTGAQATQTRDGFAIDNVVFESMPANQVPEPATALLVGLGLIGAAAARRRAA